MKLAILGTDEEILQLAAAARKLGCEIAWVGDIRGEDTASLSQLAASPADRSHEWELLLDQGSLDAVLVGRGAATSELRAEQLKRLAAAAVPLLTVQPVLDSVLPYYEVDMARRESGAVVQHYNALADLPIARQMAEWVRAGHPRLGAIHQFVCERRLLANSRSAALAAFVRDVELLAAVAGSIRRVSATGPASLDASFASLQVQMTAVALPSLRWSVAASLPADALGQFTLVGDHGALVLSEARGSARSVSTWQIETAVGDDRDVQPVEVCDPPTAAMQRFAAAATGGQRRAELGTWDAATRAMEVVEAVELSLQKGRTIEVFQQQLTERLAFRGTMAALGCGLLLVVLLAVLVVAVVGGAEGIMQEKIIPSWPLLMLAVLAFFLLLQAVPLLVPKKDTTKPRSDVC